MQISDIAIMEFISASTAGVVNAQLGFEPDFAILFTAHTGTNSDVRYWANNARFAGWQAAKAILTTGSTGVNTEDAASMTIFAGGTKISTAETANSNPKHPSRYAAFHPGDGTVTSVGLAIPAGDQVNSGRNLLIAIRMDY